MSSSKNLEFINALEKALENPIGEPIFEFEVLEYSDSANPYNPIILYINLSF